MASSRRILNLSFSSRQVLISSLTEEWSTSLIELASSTIVWSGALGFAGSRIVFAYSAFCGW